MTKRTVLLVLTAMLLIDVPAEAHFSSGNETGIPHH